MDAKPKTGVAIDWSKYSSDLNPNDHSLWVLTKFIVYYASQGLTQNIEVFKECFEVTINDQIVYKIIDNFLKRVSLATKSKIKHLENIYM